MKPTLALALALGAITPAAAAARQPEPLLPPSQSSPERTFQVVHVAAPSGVDWTDTAIGAAAGLGLSVAAVGGGLIVVGRRRRRRYATAR